MDKVEATRWTRWKPQDSFGLIILETYFPDRDTMSDLPKLLHHCSWANGAWIQFVADACPSDEYLVTRLSHILHGERAWLQRIAGEEPDRDIWAPMTIMRLGQVHDEHRAVMTRLLAEDLGRIVNYRRFTGEAYQSPVSDILLHLVLHGSHHRGQMATHASAQGLRPINTDFIQFCLIHGL
jgi:uncharacterized damage-inducible protein DinB